MGLPMATLHECHPFENEIFTMHHSGFNPLYSHGNFSLDLFWPQPMDPIKTYEYLFFQSYQKFKAKQIKISLTNIPENDKTMVVPSPPPVMDEIMLETKTLPCNQGKYSTIPLPIYKRPRENRTIHFVSPKIKQVYKPKEIVVSQPSVVPSVPPLRE